jgi:hypothetical protein
MRIEKPINIPLMTIEDRLDFDNRPKLTEEEKKQLAHKLVKPNVQIPDDWVVD